MAEPRRTLDPRFVAAARMWAAFRFPYLAVALFAAPVLLKPDSGTVGADESWRIYIDPALVDGWTVPQLGSVFVHLSGHLLREHAERARARGLAAEHIQNWLDAVDAEIDDDFLAYVDLPTPPVLGEHLGLARGRLAEEYFN